MATPSQDIRSVDNIPPHRMLSTVDNIPRATGMLSTVDSNISSLHRVLFIATFLVLTECCLL